MRLELDIFNIKDIRFGEKTSLKGGVLSMNRSEICEILSMDGRISRIETGLAHPGEKCRIFQVADVIKPRAKISKDGDKPDPAGQGRTCSKK